MIIKTLKERLENAGIKKGDIICIFSDITSFGLPEELKEEVRKKGITFLMDSYIDTFKGVVEEEGMVLMPTFSDTARKEGVFDLFDVNTTESTAGVLTNHFRKQKDVERSLDPVHSFAAWGRNAKEFLKLENFDCFGETSLFGKLYDLNAKYILFGVDMQHGATYIYYSEQKLNVYYRYFKDFLGIIKNKENQFKTRVRYFVRDLDIKFKDYRYDLEKKSLELGITKLIKFSGGNILIMKSQDIDKLIQEEVKKNKDYLIRKY